MTSNDTLDRIAEQAADEITPASQELAAVAQQALSRRAADDGWSESQTEWIVKLALQPLFQHVADHVPGPEALEKAYSEAKRQLSIGYFDDAVQRGKRPFEAFLVVVDLEKQVAERGGRPIPDYPELVLKPACEKVEGAAAQGYASAALVDIGYAAIRAGLQQA